MALLRKPFFHDNQIKRLLVQIMATFAGYQVRTGNQRDGKVRYIDVPVVHGDMDQVVSYLIGGGSTNNMNALPTIAINISELNQKAEWRLQPQHSEKFAFIERCRAPDGSLLDGPGLRKIAERFMPVPYDVRLETAIWASNKDQLYQLVEQICSVFNPSQEILLSNSPADWSFLTELTFEGNIQFEKIVPTGTEVDPMHVCVLPFTTVLWLSVPARVYDEKAIHEIHVPILEIEDSLDFDDMTNLDTLIIKASDEDIIKFDNYNLSPRS